MNTKKYPKIQNTINLLLVLTALSVLVLGCSSSNTPPNNASPSPTPTPTTPPTPSPTTAASPTPTPKNLAEAFYGEWETKDSASGNFITVKFGSATQKGDDYVGTLTAVNTKQDLAEYKVKPNNNVTLLWLPGTAVAGQSFTAEYEVSGDGNTLTIKENPPIVYRKGTTNADIQKDVDIITIKDWKIDDNTVNSLNKQFGGYFPVDPTSVVVFFPGQQVDAGYTGPMFFYQNYGNELKGMEPSRYIITSKNNIKINIRGVGEKAAKYTLLGDNVLRIEFSNGDPAINLTR
jgi:hypothetical protein